MLESDKTARFKQSTGKCIMFEFIYLENFSHPKQPIEKDKNKWKKKQPMSKGMKNYYWYCCWHLFFYWGKNKINEISWYNELFHYGFQLREQLVFVMPLRYFLEYLFESGKEEKFRSFVWVCSMFMCRWTMKKNENKNIPFSK